MVPPAFFRSRVLVTWARGDSPAVVANTLGDPLDADDHPNLVYRASSCPPICLPLQKGLCWLQAAGRGPLVCETVCPCSAVTVRGRGWQPLCACLFPGFCRVCSSPRHILSFWFLLKYFITGKGCSSWPDLISPSEGLSLALTSLLF